MARIMICEDEVHIQRLIKLVLEKQGHSVVAAGNGEECLKLLKEGELPELLLLDILMPGIDGLQVLRSIKANSDTKTLKVVLLTALAQENVVLQGINLGAIDYIRKPFHPKELVQRLEKLLASSCAA
jgi:CheY-like chemotaxis protein